MVNVIEVTKMIDEKTKAEILGKIVNILNATGQLNATKRFELNRLESRYKQDLFIKTHLCHNCDELEAEVWFKEQVF